MAVKIAGAAIIVLASYVFGVLLCKNEKLKLQQFEELLFVMKRIQSEITVSKTPTERIFAKLNTPLLSSYGFYDAIAPRKIPFSLHTEQALESIQNRLCIGEEAFHTFGSFIRAVGKNDCEYQLRELDYLTEEFAKSAKKAKEAADSNIKLKKITPFFFGALLIIILI